MIKWMRYEWQRLINRCRWSWQGFSATWSEEPSFRGWVLANVISAAMTFVLDLSGGEQAVILAIGMVVLAVELINSAIERTIDYISEDIHPLAKAAKDAGSAAVAVTAIAGGMAWLAILFG